MLKLSANGMLTGPATSAGSSLKAPAAGAPTLGNSDPVKAMPAPAPPKVMVAPSPPGSKGLMPSATVNTPPSAPTAAPKLGFYAFKTAADEGRKKRQALAASGGAATGLALTAPSVIQALRDMPMRPPAGMHDAMDAFRDAAKSRNTSILHAAGATLAGAAAGLGAEYLADRMGKAYGKMKKLHAVKKGDPKP